MTTPNDPYLFLGLATALTFDGTGNLISTRECAYDGYRRAAAEITPDSISGTPPVVHFVLSNTEPFVVPAVTFDATPMLWWVAYDRREGGNLILAEMVMETTWVAAQGRIDTGLVRFGVDDRPLTVETLTPRSPATDDDDKLDNQARREQRALTQRMSQLPTRADIEEGKRLWPNDWRARHSFYDGQTAALVDEVERRTMELVMHDEANETAINTLLDERARLNAQIDRMRPIVETVAQIQVTGGRFDRALPYDAQLSALTVQQAREALKALEKESGGDGQR